MPCSMKTLAGVVGGNSDNLLLQAADCTRHIAGRILDQFGIEDTGYLRWEGMKTT